MIAALAIIVFGISGCNDKYCDKVCKDCETLDKDLCKCEVNSSITQKCEDSGHGHFNADNCECDCNDGWAGVNCDTPLVDKIMYAVMKTNSTGKTRQFSTGDVKVTTHKGTGGNDTLVIHGSNGQNDYAEFVVYTDLNSIVSSIKYPITRIWSPNVAIPLMADPDLPGVPFISPSGTQNGELNIEYFQLDPLILKATFSCTLEEFGNSQNTITVTEGKVGYK